MKKEANHSVRKALLLPVLILFSSFLSAQVIAVGGSALYNFQTESIGGGVRASIYPNNRISIAPQFSYFFSFNKVHEYYLGIAGEYKFIQRDRINVYAIIHGGYNSWLNYDASNLKTASPNNFDFEGGVGISGTRCLRPFLEYRYNVRHFETNIQFGILYVFGCRKNKSVGHCDAYG